MSHMGVGTKQRKDFCNWCHDLKHAMTTPCYCKQPCEQPWCPLNIEDDYTPPAVPKF